MRLTPHEANPVDVSTERELELQATVERLEGFCSQVAHDLRDGVSCIHTLAELSTSALQHRNDRSSALRALQLIAQQSRRSIEVVDGLLRLARTRDVSLQLGKVNVQEVAARVVQEVGVYGAHGMPCISVSPIPAVKADADLLYSVLFNLIKNAVKFTRGRADARIEIDASTFEHAVTVCVRDNGVGFSPACAELLFKPFKRLHGASYEGCGIGLSLVRQAIGRLGGRVWAEAEPDRGARFFFTLPLADAEAPPAQV